MTTTATAMMMNCHCRAADFVLARLDDLERVSARLDDSESLRAQLDPNRGQVGKGLADGLYGCSACRAPPQTRTVRVWSSIRWRPAGRLAWSLADQNNESDGRRASAERTGGSRGYSLAGGGCHQQLALAEGRLGAGPELSCRTALASFQPNALIGLPALAVQLHSAALWGRRLGERHLQSHQRALMVEFKSCSTGRVRWRGCILPAITYIRPAACNQALSMIHSMRALIGAAVSSVRLMRARSAHEWLAVRFIKLKRTKTKS
jgi:hypothetical protein